MSYPEMLRGGPARNPAPRGKPPQSFANATASYSDFGVRGHIRAFGNATLEVANLNMARDRVRHIKSGDMSPHSQTRGRLDQKTQPYLSTFCLEERLGDVAQFRVQPCF